MPISFKSSRMLALCAPLVLLSAPGAWAQSCVWEGRAPLCAGACKPGYTQIETNNRGDGKKCVTGQKAYCCPTNRVVVRGEGPKCAGSCQAGETILRYQNSDAAGRKCKSGKAAVCLTRQAAAALP